MNVEIARTHLLECFRSALQAVDGRARVREFLERRPLQGPTCIIAVGKAASAMALGALDAGAGDITTGLVVTKSGHLDGELQNHSCLRCLEAGHPVPDARSLQAGAALLAQLESAGDMHLVFLISGGASSLVEVLPAGVGLEQLRRVNEWLHGSGSDIAGMNAVRKAISCIKGGRLLAHVQARSTLGLLMSDVRGDDPAVIGSGLLYARAAPERLPDSLPDWLNDLIDRGAFSRPRPVTPVELHTIARLDDAKAAAAAQGRRLGYSVRLAEEFIDGDAAARGRELAQRLLDGPSGFSVWGGETTVHLPLSPGRGGRSQHLALAAAGVLTGHPGVAFLAAGTDGTDGPTEDAGALVDGGTVGRGEACGFNPASCLERADAGTFLEASQDLVTTGPTGTNVMDLMLGLKY